MKRFLLPLLLIFISFQAKSQIDNVFWFVAPDVSSQHGDSPIYIRISTMELPASISLSMPANPGFAPINQLIPPNTTYSVELSPWKASIENTPADGVLNKGILLESSELITAYYEVSHYNNPAIFPFKGKNGIGLEFYVIGQNNYVNEPITQGTEAFDIVATEDDTWVTITPAIDIIGHPAGVPYQVFLTKGQTYSARTTNTTAGATLAGSHILSTKPIAITLSDDSINTGGYDLIGDQSIPVNLLGKDHIVVKGYADNTGSNNDERVYVLAISDNTSIYLDGNATPYATLNTGQLLSYAIPSADPTVYVKSSEPVYVYHLSGNPGEAGSSLIPHDSCTGSMQIGFNRTSGSFFAMVILTRSGNEDGFILNGGTGVITPTSFSPVTGTGGAWMYTRMSMSTGQVPVGANLLQNTKGKFHLGIINNLGGSSEYGFYSAYSSLYLGADRSMCMGDSLQLDAGPYMTSYQWYKKTAGVYSLVATSRKYMVHDTGYYAAVVQGDNCQLSDTIHVSYYPNSQVSLGNDTTICEGTTLALDPGLFNTYMWQNGGNSRIFNATDPGMYWVKVTNNNGCIARDTMILSVQMRPRPGTPVTGTSPVCQGSGPYTYTTGAFTDATSYSWTLPSGYAGTSATPAIDLTFSTTAVSDTIRVTASNYCGSSIGESKMGITVDPLPLAAQGILGPASVCQGQNLVHYALPGVPNATQYSWMFPSGATLSSGAGTNSINVDFALNALPGYLKVIPENNCGTGAADSIPLAVQLFPLPAQPITGTFTVCQGQTGVDYSVPAITGADEYVWSVPTGAVITSGVGTRFITVKFDSSALSGNVSVFGRSIQCGDGIPYSEAVTVNPLPLPAGIISGPSIVCQAQTGVIFTVPAIANAESYIWTLPTGAVITSGAGTAGITVSFSTSAVSGSITVHGNNSLCGDGLTSAFALTVDPLPAPAGVLSGPSPVCQATTGNSYTVPAILHATAYNWTWSGSGTTLNPSGNSILLDMDPTATSGMLTVNGINACGPGPQSALNITVHPIPLTSVEVCPTITTRDAKPFVLRGGIPLGGTWSGTGVSGGVFNPAMVPGLQDTAFVNYRYVNVYGCRNLSQQMITILNPPAFTCGNPLSDVRDGNIYPTVNLGGQCWMAANLNYGNNLGGGQHARDNCIAEKHCFGDSPAGCDARGGLYEWNEMMQYQQVQGSQGICPPAWHVPTVAEWNALFLQYTNKGFAGSPLKITGYSGFDAGLYGIMFINNRWEMDNFSTFLWSSSSAGTQKAWAHGLNSIDPSVSTYPSSTNNAFSVRCIKD